MRHILHCDMNAFYASVEVQRHPELRGKPVAVCGSQEERHGIVLTANYIAKPRGVKTGMAIWQAKQVCPDLVTLPPDMAEYIRISRYAREIYEDYTDQVEPFGLDESWLDVTGSVGLYGSPVSHRPGDQRPHQKGAGHHGQHRGRQQQGDAKLGSDYKKPDAITRIEADNYKEVVYPLPVEDLLYVGPAPVASSVPWGSAPSDTWRSARWSFWSAGWGKWGASCICSQMAGMCRRFRERITSPTSNPSATALPRPGIS